MTCLGHKERKDPLVYLDFLVIKDNQDNQVYQEETEGLETLVPKVRWESWVHQEYLVSQDHQDFLDLLDPEVILALLDQEVKLGCKDLKELEEKGVFRVLQGT